MVSKDISNFILSARLGNNALNWKFYGSVLVTTTVPKFWGKDEVTSGRRNIYRKSGDGWCYVDDGVYLPANGIAELVRAWEAQAQATIEEFEI